MAPSDGVRRSGEHRGERASGEFVTYAHFDRFLEDFRSVATTLTQGMSEVNNRLAEGSQRFNNLSRDVASVKEKNADHENRLDGHSDVVRVLLDDKKIKLALDAQDSERGKPRKTIIESVVSTVITAAVLGVLAVGYNAWRDAAIEERAREHAHATAPTPAPADEHSPSHKPTTTSSAATPP